MTPDEIFSTLNGERGEAAQVALLTHFIRAHIASVFAMYRVIGSGAVRTMSGGGNHFIFT